MSRKSLIYFLLVGFLWGIPYLLMKVAVEEIPPSAIVAGRTLIGAATVSYTHLTLPTKRIV